MTASECANRGCVDDTAVLVEFIDPNETESYCESCAINEFRTNETAVALLEDSEEDRCVVMATSQYTVEVSHPSHTQSLGTPIESEYEMDSKLEDDQS